MLSRLPLFLTVICFLACVSDIHADDYDTARKSPCFAQFSQSTAVHDTVDDRRSKYYSAGRRRREAGPLVVGIHLAIFTALGADTHYSATVPAEILRDVGLRDLPGLRLRSRRRRNNGRNTSRSGNRRTVRTMTAARINIATKSIDIFFLRNHLD